MPAADMIPLEIQVEIMKRVVHVKSLIRFRSLSKEWKSLIDSSEFITDHNSINQAKPHHLLITYKVRLLCEVKYVSIDDDDDSFPHYNFCLAVSPTVCSVLIIGSSHGLVCLRGPTLIIVWNPSIRKSVAIALPPNVNSVVFGFGVCPKTSDLKIVIIPRLIIGYEAKAEVFTLSSGAWRSISMNLPHDFIIYPHSPVVIDGVIHWAAYDHYVYNPFRIISFDLTTDEFGQVDLPDGLQGHRYLEISKLNQTLVVLDYYYPTGCHAWMMLKNGAFTKLFTVNVRSNTIVGFRKNGIPITHQKHGLYGELQVYVPGSEHVNGLGIYGSLFDMTSYTESLLLLNHSDSIIQ